MAKQPKPITLDIDLNKVFANMDHAKAVGVAEERAKWLPLWEALNEFDSYFDLDTPIVDGNGFDDTGGVNEAREKLYQAIQNLRSQGEK